MAALTHLERHPHIRNPLAHLHQLALGHVPAARWLSRSGMWAVFAAIMMNWHAPAAFTTCRYSLAPWWCAPRPAGAVYSPHGGAHVLADRTDRPANRARLPVQRSTRPPPWSA